MSMLTIVANSTLYVLTGIVAGLMSGLIGIGGGIIVVPALLIIFQYFVKVPADLAIHLATGTSLAAILIISQAAVRAHCRHGIILWSLFKRLAPGIAIGSFFGVLLSTYLSVSWLESLLAVFLLFIAIMLMLNIKYNFRLLHSKLSQPPRVLSSLISFLIGFCSGLLGVGGGVIIVPYLSYYNLEMRQIAPVSALCVTTAAITGTLMFIIMGFHEAGLPAYTTGYIYWPAVISIAIPSILGAFWGARLTYLLSQRQLEYIFIIILLITSIELIL
ncbi:sulfite exporter TauE/SafE family protein [Legionella sp. D16C41]|uniref:sulfite exporter TauE/SafE family protein n=1 Tax=Legionella sp. D16C41 TaxID=3402688 RepID=UPI003AF930A1